MARHKAQSKAKAESTRLFPDRASKSIQIRKSFNQLIRNKGVGSIDGVTFDLRHDKFDFMSWTPFSILSSALYMPGEEVDGAVENTNSIWYHWFGANPTLNTRPKDVGDQSRYYYVNRGDHVSVHDVVDMQVVDRLQHPHDEIKKKLFVNIRSADGSVQMVKEPFLIGGSTRLFDENADNRDYFLSIALRICEYFGVKNPDMLADIQPSDATASRAAAKTFELYKKIERILKAPMSDEGALYISKEDWHLRNLVNDAAMVGYLWANAEIDLKKIRQLAIDRREASKASSEGAQRGAETRQKNAANKKWRHELLPFAVDYCNKYQKRYPDKKGPSRSKIATEFSSSWTGDEDDIGSHESIEGELLRLEQQGKLQRLQTAKN